MFYQYTAQVAVEEDNHVATAAFTLNTCLRNESSAYLHIGANATLAGVKL